MQVFILRSLAVSLFLVSLLASGPRLGWCDDNVSLYESRILPLVRSPKGSSCQECHLSGLRLDDFFTDSEADTFANLRASGWINTDDPDKSKLIAFINREREDSSELISTIRVKEREAITSWIRQAINRPELLKHRASSDVGIELDEALIRHLRSDHVLARFTDNIWSVMGQCVNCHSPQRNQRVVKEHGEQVSWITPHDPEATLRYLVDAGLIDLDDPDESELRTKPTMIVDHGGGPKFPIGSAIDKKFLSFLRDYAKTRQGTYQSSRDLPKAPNQKSYLTENHLRITDLPQSWAGKLMRVDLYKVSDQGRPANRIATADSRVNEEKLVWQNPMWSLSPLSDEPPQVVVGDTYVAVLSLDRDDRIRRNPDEEFTDQDTVGQLNFHGSWKPGWQEPKIVSASKMTRRD